MPREAYYQQSRKFQDPSICISLDKLISVLPWNEKSKLS